MRIRRGVVPGLWLAIVAGAARGDDAPAAPPKPVPKIGNAFLLGLVGSWEGEWKGSGMTGTTVSRVRAAAGGTALVQETQVTVSGAVYHGLNVIRVGDDMGRLVLWRWDTLSPAEMTLFRGNVAHDGFRVASDAGAAITVRQGAAGLETTFARGDTTMFATTLRKAEKEVELPMPDAPKTGFRPAMVGTWDAKGGWQAEQKDGKIATVDVHGPSTFRWALGGRMMLHDYERETGLGPNAALGVDRWSTDGASQKVWWFEIGGLEPLVAEGPITETGWNGTGTMPDGGKIGLRWERKGDGFEMKIDLSGKPFGGETYTRRK